MADFHLAYEKLKEQLRWYLAITEKSPQIVSEISAKVKDGLVERIDAVALKLWPAGCVDPCFNSVTVLVAGFSAGRRDPGPMPCNAVPAGFAAPPRM